MEEKQRNRSLVERTYRANVLPDGNLKSVDYIDVVLKKMEDPPSKDDSQQAYQSENDTDKKL